MEHERRPDNGTLIEKTLKECVYHSFDQVSKILTSNLFIRIPLKNGSRRYHKVSRQTYCETETGKANEMANLWWFQQELKSIFRDMAHIEEPLVQYDDMACDYIKVGSTLHYIKNEEMYWPPVLRYDEKSKTNFLDFCVDRQ